MFLAVLSEHFSSSHSSVQWKTSNGDDWPNSAICVLKNENSKLPCRCASSAAFIDFHKNLLLCSVQCTVCTPSYTLRAELSASLSSFVWCLGKSSFSNACMYGIHCMHVCIDTFLGICFFVRHEHMVHTSVFASSVMCTIHCVVAPFVFSVNQFNTGHTEWRDLQCNVDTVHCKLK